MDVEKAYKRINKRNTSERLYDESRINFHFSFHFFFTKINLPKEYSDAGVEIK